MNQNFLHALHNSWKKILSILGVSCILDLVREFFRAKLTDYLYSKLGPIGDLLYTYPFVILTCTIIVIILVYLIVSIFSFQKENKESLIIDPSGNKYLNKPLSLRDKIGPILLIFLCIILISTGVYLYVSKMNKIGAIRSILIFQNIALHGNDPRDMTVFARMVIKNSTASPMTFEHFRLSMKTDTFNESDIPPVLLDGGYQINMPVGLTLAKFNEEFLYKKALNPVEPGASVCGWLVFTPSKFTWTDKRNKDVKFTISFLDSRNEVRKATFLLTDGQKDLPSEIPCTEQPFNKALLEAMKISDPDTRQSALLQLRQSYLLSEYPLGYIIFDLNYINEVKPYTAESFLKQYTLDWSVVRFTENSSNRIQIRLPDVIKNGNLMLSNAVTGGSKKVGNLGGVIFGDSEGSVLILSEILEIKKNGIIFLIGFQKGPSIPHEE